MSLLQLSVPCAPAFSAYRIMEGSLHGTGEQQQHMGSCVVGLNEHPNIL